MKLVVHISLTANSDEPSLNLYWLGDIYSIIKVFIHVVACL